MLKWSSLCILLLFETWVTIAKDIQFVEQNGFVEYADPDRIGYRHCAYWQLADGTTLYSTCDPFTFNRCGKPLKFDYSCCSGFEKIKNIAPFFMDRNKDECAQVVPFYEPCPDTIERQKEIGEFALQLSSVTELNADTSVQPYTIFAAKLEKEKSVSAQEHVVKGRFYVNELKNGMKLQTLDPNRQLYVTRNSYGTISIDCVEMINADLECKNGIIHTLRYSLSNSQNMDRSSVMSLLESHPETKLFAQDLPSAIKNELRNVPSGKRYTVLAPRQQAWEKMRQEYSGEKLQKLAASHVLPKQYCSSDLIKPKESQPNIQKEQIDFICALDASGTEKHYVKSSCGQNRELIEPDLVAKNGVVHIIDEAIIPLSIMTLEQLQQDKECAKELKIKEFLDLLEECDLQMQPGVKYAIITPQDSSFTWWSNYAQFREEYDRFQVDKEYRCKVARYHIVRSDGRLDNIDGFASNTMGHRTNNVNEPLYETTYFKKTPYGSQLNFHYSPINNMESYEMDGVTLYLTPRINVPPEQNLTDILRTRPDTKIANEQTQTAEMETKVFNQNAPKNLYLVTTDSGWRDPRATPDSPNPNLPELNMYKGKNLENYLLLNHIPLYLWGGDIGYFDKNTVHRFMSSAGVELTFWMDEKGVMRIGYEGLPQNEWPRVVKWNLPARDGIMWLLDGVLKCPPKLCPLLVEDIDFYDVYVMACQTANLPDEEDVKKNFELKPLEIALRHPEHCSVVLQLSEKTVQLIESDTHEEAPTTE